METTKHSILLIEDNPADVRLLREMFAEQGDRGISLTAVDCMKAAEKHLAENSVGLVLLDLGLPDAAGLNAIRRVRVAAPHVALVVLTGLDDDVLSLQALHEGAQDYLVKGEIQPRELMRSLRYANERKRVERMKNDFVATVSHELRTPLTAIHGSLGLISNDVTGAMSQRAAQMLTLAYRNSCKLVRLVDDILDIEKLESGKVAFNFERIDVRSLAQRAIENIQGFAEECGVTVHLRDEPDDGGAADVRADPFRLTQVVTNLLSNAIKFSPPDSEVVVAVDAGADGVRLSVRDHGAGIPQDFKTHVFEKFMQASEVNTRLVGGTGLGLSIAKQIVHRLGGEIGFADASGGGTIFYVEMPCWEPEERLTAAS